MPSAALLIRQLPHYRTDAFTAGLERVGFSVTTRRPAKVEPGDVLVLWNRRPADEHLVAQYLRAGGEVLIAENGYIGPGRKLFALAKRAHNGGGSWREGGPERFDSLGVELKPWREAGEHILVLGQRGIGSAGVAQPKSWLHSTVRRLQAGTKREVRLRRHPGHQGEPYEALSGAHAAVTWGSGAAIKALAAGIPVFYGFGGWIGAPAALPLAGAELERPLMDDEARLAMFRRLAWAQWSVEEVASGEAFAWLLES